MKIHCDHCGVEISKENAVAIKDEEEVLYFCSEACLGKAGHVAPYQFPDRDDRGVGPLQEADPGEADPNA